MRLRKTSFTFLSTLLLLALSFGTAFAQGKGKGGKHGGGQGGKHGGGPPAHAGGNGKFKEKHNGGWAGQPAPVYQQSPIQSHRVWNRIPQQMPNQNWGKQAKHQQKQWERSVKHEQKQWERAAKQDRKQWERVAKQQEKGRDRWMQAQQAPPAWAYPQHSYNGYKNRGQMRRAEVHARNAARKAARDDRYYTRNGYYYQVQPQPQYPYNGSYYPYGQSGTYSAYPTYPNTTVYPRVYNEPAYDYGYGQPAYYGGYAAPNFSPENILRSVIFTVLGSGPGFLDEIVPAIVPQLGYGLPMAYPQYSYYQQPRYVSQNVYGGDPYSPSIYSPEYPYAVLSDSPYNSGFEREMWGQLIAAGYNQGYQDGLAARQANVNSYHDPYSYGNVMYDPYSYSLGENRRMLSEGYELGYRDALNGAVDIDPYQTSNVDLVSALIGTALEVFRS
jgi:hypothetical protein